MRVTWILLWCNIVYLKTTALPFYHQKDYDIKGDRVELGWYDHSIFKNAKCNYYWHNRTQKAFNMSVDVLIDGAATDDIFVTLEAFKFASNEYREFPLKVGANICEEYAKNNFNIQNLLKNISNIHGCPLKIGFYYAYNLKPDVSLLPPFIPRGQYKGVFKLYRNKNFIAEANAYGEIVDKPLKWV